MAHKASGWAAVPDPLAKAASKAEPAAIPVIDPLVAQLRSMASRAGMKERGVLLAAAARIEGK